MVGHSLHYFLTVFVVHCFNVHIAGLSVRWTPGSSMKSSAMLGNTFQNQIGSRLSKAYMAADEVRAVVKSSYSDNLSVLMSKTKDRVSVNIAIVNIMKDPEFIKKSNALSIISDALKNCRVPSHHMLFYWKEAVYFGAPVKKQDLRDLLFYCFNFGKGDTLTLQNAIDTVCKFNRVKYWNAALVNLIIQIYSERLDSVYDKRNAVEKGFALSEIIRDLMMLKEKILDEKSIVMLLKYFSNIEDYESLKSVFLYRDTAIKRSIADKKIDGTSGTGGIGGNGGDTLEGQENSIIYNVYLSSVIKFSLKEQNSDENIYIEEAHALVESMIISKSADFYTLNTMLEYYALKINKYNRIKGDNYTVKVEKTVKKCFELWNQKFFTQLRENVIKNKSFEDIPRGIKISYSIILKCLLSSVDDDNKRTKLNEIKNVNDNDNGKENENENIVVNKKNKKDQEKNKNIENIIDKNENKKNDYMAIAFRLTLEMPCEEAISSVLFSLGKSETECMVAIQYMHLLNRKKESLLTIYNHDNNYNSNDNNDNNNVEKFSDEENNVVKISENENKHQKEGINKDNENNENERSDMNDELFDMIETNHIDSLLGGYYDSYRHDLVIQAYLTAYNNNQPLQNSDLNTNSNMKTTIKNEKFNPFQISNMNIKGNTRAFNLFMASLKEIIETESLPINKKVIDRSIKHNQLWEFSKTVLTERMTAEKNRIMKIQNNQNIKNDDTKNSNNKNIFNVENNNNNSNNDSKNNIDYDNGNDNNDNYKSDKIQEFKGITGVGSDMSDNDPYLDAYTIASSIDVANIFPDMIMAKDLFYTHHNINTNTPSQRVVQSFLRSFQLPSHLYELDQFMNNILVKSIKYKNLFTVNRYDYTGNNVRDGEELRTFDEILNAYKRVGNLPIALDIAANHYNKFSDVSLENLLIHFSRYWRDYENESIGIIDLLKGQERLERRYNNQMNDFREANLQSRNPPIKKDYYSSEAEAYVRTPSVYVQLHETTGRCLSVEAGILGDILCARAVQGTPSYVFWSALVGVLLSRGEKDAAIDILLKMENIDDNNILLDNKNKLNKFKNDMNDYNSDNNDNNNDNNNNNNNNNYNNDINVNMNDINKNYKKNFGINKPKINKNKKPYKGQDIAQTVELGILYALDGSLPLLTKNGEKALIAMNLIRLLPKQENSNIMKQNNVYNVKDVKDMKVNSNDKSLIQSQTQLLNQNQNQNSNEKINNVESKKIHNLDGISEIIDRIPKELRLNSAEKRTVCTIGDILDFLESCRGRDLNYNENGNNDNGIGVKIEKMMNENNQNKKDENIISDFDSYNYNLDDNDDYNLDDDYSASAYVQSNKARTVRTDKDKVPVGIALLQSLFGDAINDKKYSQAARIIRLLEGSRLVIDLDAPSLAAASSSSSSSSLSSSSLSSSSSSSSLSSSLPPPLSLPLPLPLPLSNNHQNQEGASLEDILNSEINLESSYTSTTSSPNNTDNKNNRNNKDDNNNMKLNNNDFINTIIDNPNKESAVKIVRETLARKWAAMLIASSLNKLKSNVAGSVKMLAALQYLQKDEIKPLD